MRSCNTCPFNPDFNSKVFKCGAPLPCFKNSKHANAKIHIKCYADSYVIKKLAQKDPLATMLSFNTLETALKTRDKKLFFRLFSLADSSLKNKFWEYLKNFEIRSLTIINPIFALYGMPELKTIPTTGTTQEEYIKILANHY